MIRALLRPAVWSGLALVVGQPGAATPAQIAAGVPVPAVWREHHVDFFYGGRTARYSCDGLRNKVRALLLDLGARRDLNVSAFGCGDSELQRSATMGPRLRITFAAPVPRDRAGKPPVQGADAADDAHFEAFMITSDAFRNLGPGDCELVDEFARQILTKLAVRDLQQDITCVPYQSTGNRFLVKGEVLRIPARNPQTGS